MRFVTSSQFDGNMKLRFSQTAVAAFKRHQQLQGRPEAGGILLGRIYPGSKVVVELATTPNPLDRAGPAFFDRSRDAAQQIVNTTWRKSGGQCIYLGEWHTHAQNLPTPSRRDRTMIRNMFNQTQMEIDFLVLVVVGLEDIWVGKENGISLIKLDAACSSEE